MGLAVEDFFCFTGEPSGLCPGPLGNVGGRALSGGDAHCRGEGAAGLGRGEGSRAAEHVHFGDLSLWCRSQGLVYMMEGTNPFSLVKM